MTMNALALPARTTPSLSLRQGGAETRPATWHEKRSMLRQIVGGSLVRCDRLERRSIRRVSYSSTTSIEPSART